MKNNPRIAFIGAGLGGTAGAGLMAKAGFNVKVYEQAPSFARMGAGIHLGPNVMKVMRKLEIEDELNRTGAHPDYWYSRDGITGDVMAQIPLGDYALSHYGASYLTVHRGDFHKLMTDALPDGVLEFNKKLDEIEDLGDKVVMKFADGTTEEADFVIGADGINSKVRESLLGEELPIYTGYVAHRAVFPTPIDSGALPFDMCCKWWDGDRHMMVYFVTSKKDEIYYVTGVPVESWDMSKSWEPCTKDEMRETFKGWHSSVQALIEGTQEVTRWPLLERDPLPVWS
ncbi:MAG TPA: 6-hydroxynicotinate 3-monooxygenase, partial [Pusillimonas sp.]|nr:6-hydroxynicotinate 3-monooxygenase [Pusillimonas sp.]